jgi:hypothetical protein
MIFEKCGGTQKIITMQRVLGIKIYIFIKKIVTYNQFFSQMHDVRAFESSRYVGFWKIK